MKAKSYCIAFGCLNNNKDRNLTFFSLPKDIERRKKWLKLIDREDLLKKEVLKRRTHVVCSAHFEDSSIKIIKHLQENAFPLKLLYSQLHKGSSCPEAQSTSAPVKDKAKEIIAKVYHRIKYEAENGVEKLTDARWRTSQAVGVSESTISRILREERRASTSNDTSQTIFKSPSESKRVRTLAYQV